MNYPDGFDDRCLEPEISDEEHDKAVEIVADDITEAGPEHLGEQVLGAFGLLDNDDVVERIRAIFNDHPENPRNWILEELQESAASGWLDITAVERYFAD